MGSLDIKGGLTVCTSVWPPGTHGVALLLLLLVWGVGIPLSM